MLNVEQRERDAVLVRLREREIGLQEENILLQRRQIQLSSEIKSMLLNLYRSGLNDSSGLGSRLSAA